MKRNNRGIAGIGVLIAVAAGYVLGYAVVTGPYKHEGKPVTPPYKECPSCRK